MPSIESERLLVKTAKQVEWLNTDISAKSSIMAVFRMPPLPFPELNRGVTRSDATAARIALLKCRLLGPPPRPLGNAFLGHGSGVPELFHQAVGVPEGTFLGTTGKARDIFNAADRHRPSGLPAHDSYLRKYNVIGYANVEPQGVDTG